MITKHQPSQIHRLDGRGRTGPGSGVGLNNRRGRARWRRESGSRELTRLGNDWKGRKREEAMVTLRFESGS